MDKKFTMIDEAFICLNCKTAVEPLGYTARDHCPNCLCSLHVDDFPGDRSVDCHGILEPIAVEVAKKGTYKIVYQCKKCNEVKRNIVASDDNFEKLLQVMKERAK